MDNKQLTEDDENLQDLKKNIEFVSTGVMARNKADWTDYDFTEK